MLTGSSAGLIGSAGIVLAILSGRPAYGYEITAWLREKGFSDIAEGTVYALLIRIEQRGLVDVEKGPLREGAAAQGLLPQRSGTRTARRILEDPELPHRTARTAPRRRQTDMATGWTKLLETIYGPLEQKRRYRQYKARTKRLPENYHTAIDALERYSRYFGHGTADGGLSMLEDLADLFEQGAANGTPIREIVGNDPVEFAEAFLRNYPQGQWIIRERDRLTSAIDRAAGEDTGNEGTSG
jgi:DNA-binding ferritin-like protein (Dps family)